MSYGILVGRFQVNALHEGHRDLFDQVAARHKRVIVFVGTNPGGLSRNHPLDFITREKMIKAAYPDFVVLPLDDCRSDIQWSRELDAEIAKTVKGVGEITLYGGRDSFVPHYCGKYKPVELALDPRKHKISATDIRKEFSETVIESPDFRAGMIYASAYNYPVLLACVDIAALHQSGDKLELLLGRKAGESQWRFPGGHAEAMSASYERDAMRELREETHAQVEELSYVGSLNVDDWRYRDVPDRKIRTILFRGFTMSLAASAGDDLAEVRWFDVSKLTTFDLMEEHIPLLHLLMLDLKQKGLLKYADTVSA